MPAPAAQMASRTPATVIPGLYPSAGEAGSRFVLTVLGPLTRFLSLEENALPRPPYIQAMRQQERMTSTLRMPAEFYTRNTLAELVAAGLCEVGDYTYGCPNVSWWGEHAKLKIGRYCSIASEVTVLLGGNHRSDWVSTYPFNTVEGWHEAADIRGQPSTNGDVVIGNDVWLGQGCTILSGVTIGDGAIVGTEALVTRDVPSYSVVGGNPAKLIRMRFSEPVIKRLQAACWWNWPEARLREALPLLMSNEVERFLTLHAGV